MTRGKKSGKKKKLIRGRHILLLIIVAALVYSFSGSGESKATHLAKGIKAFEEIAAGTSSDFETAISELKKAKGDTALASWANLYLGKLYLEKNDSEHAHSYLKEVENTSPAGLDAKIDILRIEALTNTNEKDATTLAPIFSELEEEASKYFREDLKPKIFLLQGNISELGITNFPETEKIYNSLRATYPNSPEAKEAGTRLMNLREKLTGKKTPEKLDTLLQEISSLLSEGNPLTALSFIEKAKELTKLPEPTLQILQLEEKVQRALKRPLEADHVLQLIASKQVLGYSDKAQRKVAENFWNTNAYPEALETIARFYNTFPTSPEKDDVLYAEGRIYEEQKKFIDARRVYAQLKDSKDTFKKLLAIKRTAWTYLQEANNAEAGKHFNEGRVVSSNLIASASNLSDTQLQDLKTDFHHFLFWEAFLQTTAEEKRTRLLELASSDRFGYYGMLAKKELSESFSLKPTVDFNVCKNSVRPEFEAFLSVLREADLKDIAQKEIYFAFNVQQNDELSAENLKLHLTRIYLNQSYGKINQGITTAYAQLKKYAPLLHEEAFADCALYLNEFLYPTPYEHIYNTLSTSAQIPAALSYAITHTESRFDENARSRSDARGLMQLLESTAKEEGLKDDESLYDIETNITCGTKHLKRLLDTYGGEYVYTIAAYNAGRTSVKRWQERFPNLPPLAWAELISYPETKDYVRKVLLANSVYEKKFENVTLP